MKVYKQKYYPQIPFAISIIFLLIGFFVPFLLLLSLISLGYAIYYYFLKHTYTIDNSLITKKKFITSIELKNNFSNTIEYDVIKRKTLFCVIFGSTKVIFNIKIRRGINEVEQETFIVELDDKDVENFINDLSEYLNSIKVKI